VEQAYAAALQRLREAGVQLAPVEAPALARVAEINARGGFSALELHRRLRVRLVEGADLLDPRVLRRVRLGAGRTDTEWDGLRQARAALQAEIDPLLAGFDAVLSPTAPIVAPTFQALEQDGDYDRLNLLALRNTSVANMLDLPSISLPCQRPGALPVGLMLTGRRGEDAALLELARALQPLCPVSG
jgi:aspartyl-tRNA(Asn)/glutamyl-tRNA(Gln) amidotransferase subunit A